jgi:uncharacterized protein RhaS with RHS repeats
MYYRARYYNPAWGRFIAEDPIGIDGGTNPYGYANQNPVSLSDPSGRDPFTSAATAGCIADLETGCVPGAIAGAVFAILAGSLAAVIPTIWCAEAQDNQPQAAPTTGATNSNTNPYPTTGGGPVSEPVIAVDSKGNAIPVQTGEQITSSPDGKYQQVRDSNGDPTGTRLDAGGHRGQSDPPAQGPHANVPGVTQPNGNPHLPIYQ